MPETLKCFVTGGSGFVGAHLVRALLARGAEVRCLVRRGGVRHNLDGLPVELCEGDLRDRESLVAGITGCTVVYHVAADYRLWVPDPDSMYAANVDGTENVLAVAADCAVERVVYTSTVGALGLHPRGEPSDETAPVSLDDMTGHYKRSKFLAERAADRWAERGLPVVTVNPSAPVGDLDIKPTATGQMIVDFLNGKMRAYVDTGLNLIDVRDVAEGHILAAERGRPGERYILGHRNMTLLEICGALSRITGIPAPRVRLPHWIPLVASAVDSSVSRVTGRRPALAMDAVKLARHKMFFDSGKALRELGLPQTPVEDALRRAVTWFETHGYTRRRAAQ